MESQHSFADGTRLYNLDETSTTSVQRPSISTERRKRLQAVKRVPQSQHATLLARL